MKNKGRTSLDLTGPHAFYRHFVKYFGCEPMFGNHQYKHNDQHYKIKMDLYQNSKYSIIKFNNPNEKYISVKALGEKQHRELLLDPEFHIPYKKPPGIMQNAQNHRKNDIKHRKNDYAEYWKQNKVFY